HAVRILRAAVLAHEAFDQGTQLLARRELLRPHLFDESRQHLHMVLADLHGQRVLVSEVVIQRRLGQAAGLGHLVHRGADKALRGEQARGLNEDLLAAGIESGGATACHQRSSKEITTFSVSACAWQERMKPAATSALSSAKFLSMRTWPSIS